MTNQPAPRWTLGTMLWVGLGVGLVGGLGELAVQHARRHLLGQFLTLGRDIVWMIPAADAVLGVTAALVLWLVGAVIPPFRRPLIALTALGWLAGFGALFEVPRLAPWAAALIGLGVSIQTARLALRREAGFPRLARRTALGLAGVTLAMGLGARGWWWLAERRAEAGLAAAPANARNVVLLVLDTVRAWNLSLYGHQRPTTPHLDRRAKEAIVFDRAYSESPWTLPAHGTMFTGRSPSDLSTSWFRPLDGAHPTLAEVLGEAGFLTGGFVGNRRYAVRETGLARGFHRYQDYPATLAETLRSSAVLRPVLSELQARFGERNYWARKSAAAVNAEFLAWLDSHRASGRPFFAFLNYFDAHTPYTPPSPWRERFATQSTPLRLRGPNIIVRELAGRPIPEPVLRQLRDRYDATIAYLDEQIESLVGELRARGIADRTAVVVVSDHGELLGEHNLIDHGNALYLPLLHVPLVILEPGRPAGAGRRIPDPVSLRDLPATILELAGAASPPLPGRSLSRYWTAPASLDEPAPIPVSVDYHPRLWWQGTPINRGDMRGLIADSLLYIVNGDGSEELYGVRDRGATDLARLPAYREELTSARARLRQLFPATAAVARR